MGITIKPGFLYVKNKDTGEYVDLLVAGEKTQECVDKWFAEHPDAQVNIPDGSITAAKMADGVFDDFMDEWIEENPDAFAVADGSITDEKLASDVKSKFYFTTPEEHGAVGNGDTNNPTDDREAIEATIAHAAETGKKVIFKRGTVYHVAPNKRTGITLPSNIHIDLNGATIRTTTAGGKIFTNLPANSTATGYGGNGNIVIENGTFIYGNMVFGHGKNITIRNMKFQNCAGLHHLEICACNGFTIKNCEFLGAADNSGQIEYVNIDPCTYNEFPYSTEGSAFYDGTNCKNITIDGCYFHTDSSSATYQYGMDAIGVHADGNITSLHEHIRITNCEFKNFSATAVLIQDMLDVYVGRNRIVCNNGSQYALAVGPIASQNVAFVNNELYGGKSIYSSGCTGFANKNNDSVSFS